MALAAKLLTELVGTFIFFTVIAGPGRSVRSHRWRSAAR
jgi:hypothetical protein